MAASMPTMRNKATTAAHSFGESTTSSARSGVPPRFDEPVGPAKEGHHHSRADHDHHRRRRDAEHVEGRRGPGQQQAPVPQVVEAEGDENDRRPPTESRRRTSIFTSGLAGGRLELEAQKQDARGMNDQQPEREPPVDHGPRSRRSQTPARRRWPAPNPASRPPWPAACLDSDWRSARPASAPGPRPPIRPAPGPRASRSAVGLTTIRIIATRKRATADLKEHLRAETLAELGPEHDEAGDPSEYITIAVPTVVGGVLKLSTMPLIETGNGGHVERHQHLPHGDDDHRQP